MIIDVYNEINNILNKIDFNMLWPGFKKYEFALYDNEKVYFENKVIDKTNEFIANTAIKYNDKYIAIWNMAIENEKIDLEILATKIIHEMFHAFQMENNDSRFANEFEALLKYKNNAKNLSIKYEEVKLLVELVNNFNIEKFNELLKYKKYRLHNFEYEYNYECMIEQIEGTALFVELKALAIISNEKYFESFSSIIRNVIIPDNLIPIRIISYDLGMLLIKILEDNKIDFSYEITEELLGLSILKNVNCEKINFTNSFFENKVLESEKKLKELIDNTLVAHKRKIIGKFDLIGVNIYSAKYFEGYIYTQYFLAYKDNGESIVLNGDYIIYFDGQYITKIYEIH